MSNQWTDEQREAITSRGGNLLVAAAAGAGKTTVLVERIISRIIDPTTPLDVDRLLVVTFTNAAAAEMRERIGRALAQEMGRQPNSKHLHRQINLLGRACISTMHSFCLDLLREHFYRVDLDPAFRVADETEAALIRMEALEELFERRYAACDNLPFTILVDSYGGRRDDTVLQQLVLDAYQFARSTPHPNMWLARLPENFKLPEDASFDHLPWSATLKKSLEMELSGALASLEQALRLARRPGGPTAYLGNLEEERDMLSQLLEACSAGSPWMELYTLFNKAGFGRLKPAKKGETEPKLQEQVRKLREDAKKKLAGLKSRYFSRRPEELCADLRKVAPLVEELAALVRDFGEAYRKAKAAKGVVDFNDLEHYALQILEEQGPEGPVPSQAALELQERFVEVLVDEYQDINAVQEAILQLVSRQGEGEPNLFMVGDVKQSIYRFRLAEPGLFLEKYKNYPVAKGGRERCLNLTKNFRSRRGVIDAVNFIFRQLMTPAVGELSYGTEAELVYGATYPPVPDDTEEPDETVELFLIERDDSLGGSLPNSRLKDGGVPDETEGKESGEDIEEDLDAVQKEARLVAARIKEMVEETPGGGQMFRIYDNKSRTWRFPQYRDVVVLTRATVSYANTFIEEFRQAGIPAYAETATGYFEATEVETILSLLKVIDNPRQDIPLAGVLRSPIVGLKGADLAGIRLASPKGDFFEAVEAAASSGQGELSKRLKDFLVKLEAWRTTARQSTLADLIWTIYRETGYYSFVGGLPGGSQRQANLRALYHRALQYETTAFRGLFLFLRFIERVREGGRDLGTARALSEKENVVRIMSIHKSKGLEFPVVFVVGVGRKFNFKDLNRVVLFHKDLGAGPQLVDPEARVIYPTAAGLALKHKLQMEALAEEMRILYVAMTRAKEKLILVGSARNLPECARRWCGPVGTAGWTMPEGMLAGAKTFLDWLVPAIARHKNGAEIRKLGLAGEEPPEEVAVSGPAWKVVFAGGRSLTGKENEAVPEQFSLVQRMKPLELSGPLADTIKARLEWSYPAAPIAGRAAKASVTEIKRRFDLFEEGEECLVDFRPTVVRPLFLQERGLTAAEAGVALHLVMQNLDLKKALDTEGIREQIAWMVEQELLTHEQAAVVPIEQIAAFFTGSLGRRVLTGREVQRELPFTLALPAGELYPELREYPDETVLVQGVVDCLVDEQNGYLLLDYKTDRIPAEQVERAAARYRIQLNVYARAVEDILGKQVKEKYLYFFNPGIGVMLK